MIRDSNDIDNISKKASLLSFLRRACIISLTYHFHLHRFGTRAVNGRCHGHHASVNAGSLETYIVQFDCRAILRVLEKDGDVLAIVTARGAIVRHALSIKSPFGARKDTSDKF